MKNLRKKLRHQEKTAQLSQKRANYFFKNFFVKPLDFL